MDIGARIKELRLLKELTQEELADRCELTKGFISQVENDLTSPSISSLENILLALGSNLADFFMQAENQEQVVFTPEDYFEKDSGDSVITWLVTNSQKNRIEPILLTLSADGEATEDMPHEGEEFGYVLSGAVTLTLGKNTHRLKAGDSFYYTADRRHFLKNTGKETAKILWISSPPNF